MSPKPAPAPSVLASERPADPTPPPAVPWKVVYTIVKRAGKRDVWLRVGVAFPNRDGSLNVRLDALPTNGALHIRDAPTPGEEPAAPRPGELGHDGEG